MGIWITERLVCLLKVIQKILWSNQKFCAALPSSALVGIDLSPTGHSLGDVFLWHGFYVSGSKKLGISTKEVSPRACQNQWKMSCWFHSVGQLKTSGSKAILHFWCEHSVTALDSLGQPDLGQPRHLPITRRSWPAVEREEIGGVF